MKRIAAKSRRYLAEGRILVTRVDGRTVDAVVRGDSGEFYTVSHRPGQWECSCPAFSRCSHVQALMLITAPVGLQILSPTLMVGAAS